MLGFLYRPRQHLVPSVVPVKHGEVAVGLRGLDLPISTSYLMTKIASSIGSAFACSTCRYDARRARGCDCMASRQRSAAGLLCATLTRDIVLPPRRSTSVMCDVIDRSVSHARPCRRRGQRRVGRARLSCVAPSRRFLPDDTCRHTCTPPGSSRGRRRGRACRAPSRGSPRAPAERDRAMQCSIMYCTVLYCTILHCTKLQHCTT